MSRPRQRKRKLPSVVREAVLERDGYRCFFCPTSQRASEETLGAGLHVHHMDQTGGSKEPNDRTDNLVTLCNICHQKVHAITNKLLKRLTGKVGEGLGERMKTKPE